MSKLVVKMVERAPFVAKRYENFLKKKKFFGGTSGKGFHLTDLDRDYGDGPVRDLVICDGCMQNIADPHFVMVEDQLVYHRACCEGRPDIEQAVKKAKLFPEPEPEQAPLPDNVILFPGTGGVP